MLSYTIVDMDLDPVASHDDADVRRLALSLGVTLAFVATFSVSWGVVTWVVAAELAPLRWHAGALALASAVNWLCNAAVAHFAQLVSQSVAFAAFGTCSLFAAVYVHQCLPETAGASLENVGVLWAARILHQDPSRLPPSQSIFRRLRQLGSSSSSPPGSQATLPVPVLSSTRQPMPPTALPALVGDDMDGGGAALPADAADAAADTSLAATLIAEGGGPHSSPGSCPHSLTSSCSSLSSPPVSSGSLPVPTPRATPAPAACASAAAAASAASSTSGVDGPPIKITSKLPLLVPRDPPSPHRAGSDVFTAQPAAAPPLPPPPAPPPAPPATPPDAMEGRSRSATVRSEPASAAEAAGTSSRAAPSGRASSSAVSGAAAAAGPAMASASGMLPPSGGGTDAFLGPPPGAVLSSTIEVRCSRQGARVPPPLPPPRPRRALARVAAMA